MCFIIIIIIIIIHNASDAFLCGVSSKILGWFSSRTGNVSWRRRAKIKQLAWPMAERQIEHRKSCLVLSARFPAVNWRSRPVAPISSLAIPKFEWKQSLSCCCYVVLIFERKPFPEEWRL